MNRGGSLRSRRTAAIRSAPKVKRSVRRWGVLWRSDNRLDGKRTNFMFHDRQPVLFMTRREARAWIKEFYGYIAERPDLRAEPHGWKVPLPVRVVVTLEAA
jgi:hypothetical protein